jgi:hypothetical protein
VTAASPVVSAISSQVAALEEFLAEVHALLRSTRGAVLTPARVGPGTNFKHPLSGRYGAQRLLGSNARGEGTARAASDVEIRTAAADSGAATPSGPSGQGCLEPPTTNGDP